MPIFPGRPFPPGRRRPGGRLPPAAERALARLRQAHTLLAQAQYAQAAGLFAELADEATARGLPRAPQLHLQSGRAWILATEIARGQDRLRRGLLLMGQTGQIGRLQEASRRLLNELRARNLEAEAAALEGELSAAFPGLDFAATAAGSPIPPQPIRGRLPTKCPSCGGTVHPDTVEWIDETSTACGYCGSIIQSQV